MKRPLNTKEDLVAFIDECLDPEIRRYRRNWHITLWLCGVLVIALVCR